MTEPTTSAATPDPVGSDVVRAVQPQPGDRFERAGNLVVVMGFTSDGRVRYRCASCNGASAECTVTLEEWARLVRNTLDENTQFIPANAQIEARRE